MLLNIRVIRIETGILEYKTEFHDGGVAAVFSHQQRSKLSILQHLEQRIGFVRHKYVPSIE
jgi:hypothetical protein